MTENVRCVSKKKIKFFQVLCSKTQLHDQEPISFGSFHKIIGIGQGIVYIVSVTQNAARATVHSTSARC